MARGPWELAADVFDVGKKEQNVRAGLVDIMKVHDETCQ
jgi:hypothetical protein